LNDTPATSDQTDSTAEPLSEFYLFLSMTMRYPEADFFTDEFLDAFENLLTDLELQKEQQSMQACRQDDEDLLQTLKIEYTRLFINAVPHVIVPPFASVYMDGDHDLQGKTTQQTRDFYRENGYDIADSSEPADHICFELEFLAALVREGKFDREEEFLKKYFRPWFGRFRDRLTAETIHPYYSVSIQLIDAFTKQEE
jgi:TorA maturation chaperone TorD